MNFKFGIVARLLLEQRHEVEFTASTLEEARQNAIDAVKAGLFHPLSLPDSETTLQDATIGSWDDSGEWIELATQEVLIDERQGTQ